MKPVGTLDYEVLNGDTIEKIALKWNSTPTNILHLNCLATRTIFPGQVLYVPDPSYVPPPPSTPPASPMVSGSPLTVISEVHHHEKQHDRHDKQHTSSESVFSNSGSQPNVASNSFNIFRVRLLIQISFKNYTGLFLKLFFFSGALPLRRRAPSPATSS